MTRSVAAAAALLLTLAARGAHGQPTAAPSRAPSQPSAIRSEREAKRDDAEWGTLYGYYEGEGYGTRDGLAAVAVIKPGREIHPPHEHAEEEYLIVIEGTGTWHLAGKERPANPGDMLYAAPWDVHGIRNTGDTPLRFVVWKFNAKGVAPAVRPK